jgi:hypothetical protein
MQKKAQQIQPDGGQRETTSRRLGEFLGESKVNRENF